MREQLCLSRDWGQEFMATRLPEAHRWDDPERALVTTPWEHSPIHSTSRCWGNVCRPFWAHCAVPCPAWANPLVLWWPGARELSQQMPWQLIWGFLLSVFIAIYPALREQINAQALRAGALGWPWGMGWGGRREGVSGWGTHVDPWLIHVNVWQKPLQYCKVTSLQLK